MRNTVFIAIFICTNLILNAQNTNFEILLKSSTTDDIVSEIIEGSNGSFYLPCLKFNYEEKTTTLTVYNFSDNGELLFEKTIEMQTEIVATSTNGIMESPDKNLYLFTRNNQTKGFNFQKRDLQLNIIWEKEHYFGNFQYFSICTKIYTSKGNILLAGMAADENSPDFPNSLFIFEFDNEGELVKEKIYHYSNQCIISDIIENKKTNNFLIFAQSYDLGGSIIQLNSEFEILSSVELNERYDISFMQAKEFTDTTFLFTTSVTESDNNFFHYDISLQEMDFTTEKLRETTYGNVNTIERPSFNQSLDYLNSDTLFIGGVKYNSNKLYSCEGTYLWICKLKSNFEPYWQYYYGNGSVYIPLGILATKDGGCIIIARYYDENTMDYEHDIYILKVDKDGNLHTSTEETLIKPLAKVFPNPTSDYLQIITSEAEQKTVSIYNTNGQLMQTQSFAGEANINVTTLPAGAYIYKIQLPSGQILTGKWIKK